MVKVKALNPDLLLYGGDITEGDRENETTETVEFYNCGNKKLPFKISGIFSRGIKSIY